MRAIRPEPADGVRRRVEGDSESLDARGQICFGHIPPDFATEHGV
jgi:hypothetical protein